MGGSSFSAPLYRKISADYSSKTKTEIFTSSKECPPDMDPKKIKLRECRDSALNPKAVPIAVFLDETGSMSDIPEDLIKNYLGDMIEKMHQHGVNNPAILFAGIGDHECDVAPLQTGQFESGTIELNNWITRIWLEQNGGGNDGESYLLAWYFASRFISTDHYEKRGCKGLLFTVGDEPTLRSVDKNGFEKVFGPGQYSTMTAEEMLNEARERFHVFHIHIAHGYRTAADSRWKKLLGQNLIVLDDYTKLAETIAATTAIFEGADKSDVLSTMSSSTSTALANINVGVAATTSVITF